MKSFKEFILEGRSYGHTLWLDPRGKVYDMNDRKQITDPKGFAYTHYDWVYANFTKYFGKEQPARDEASVVYDTPHEKGWARVRNTFSEVSVEVDMKKLNRSQKKTLRDIFDMDISRRFAVDAWKKNKTSRSGDLFFTDYEEIVDFLS